MTGQPVNVSVQQDTQEFLNMIFDKLERQLKHTPFSQITDSVYGGRTSNQTICHGCGKIRERLETLYTLSVEVKNMKNIYDSLEKSITGETIDDYFCDECKKKNSITKRTCIDYLPNVLIVHLQRIVFDLDTLMNQKINSRLEFPFDLNMEPYTKEGLEWRERAKKNKGGKGKKADDGADGDNNNQEDKADKDVDIEDASPEEKPQQQAQEEEQQPGPYKIHPKEYYEYKLAGVVVHMGTAEFGHYYSYINTNRGEPSKKEANKKDKWLEFNDSTIRDFNPDHIENECFGGASNDSSDDAWGWVKVGKDNSKNAYILVYERVIKDPLKLQIKDEADEQYLRKAFQVDKCLEEKPDSV